MSTFKSIVFGSSLLASLACSHTEPKQKSSALLSQDQMNGLMEADVIILGELHDNEHHHKAQLQILKKIGNEGRLNSVIFEQATWEQQSILDRLDPETIKTLPQDLNWQESGWPNYQLYAALFQTAVKYKARAIAGNINQSLTKLIYADGYSAVFSSYEQQLLGLKQELEPKALEDISKEIFDGHCQTLSKAHVTSMIPIQRARDAAMALAYWRTLRPGQAVFIVGSAHARKDFGIPTYIKKMNPNLKIYSIGMFELGGAEPAEGLYDAIIKTPAQAREDPCIQFKKIKLKDKTGAKEAEKHGQSTIAD